MCAQWWVSRGSMHPLGHCQGQALLHNGPMGMAKTGPSPMQVYTTMTRSQSLGSLETRPKTGHSNYISTPKLRTRVGQNWMPAQQDFFADDHGAGARNRMSMAKHQFQASFPADSRIFHDIPRKTESLRLGLDEHRKYVASTRAMTGEPAFIAFVPGRM
eukprot:TRINITY_DN94258_c0_g1_i1.p1 TRINITY_DN94258_c0_g1~~TRINITY_DN94258_c0_g1_i1.p1  ORF type:complete len:159 (+),score=5.73 TRINITY_DN94258_c0_g1_i1:41-517(+)